MPGSLACPLGKGGEGVGVPGASPDLSPFIIASCPVCAGVPGSLACLPICLVS